MSELNQLALGLSPDDYEEEKARTRLRMRLAPKAAKSGRPRLNRKEGEADDKKKRALFNESEAHRRNLGEVTLMQLARSLQQEKPPIQDALSRAVSIQTKYKNAGPNKPRYTRERAPVLNEYLLPAKLLDKCVAVLPVRNTQATAIDAFTQRQPSQEDDENAAVPGHDMDISGQHPDNSAIPGQSTDKSGQHSYIDRVYIAGIETFSHEQIEAVAYLSSVQRQCEEGVAFNTSLTQDAASVVPGQQQSTLQSMSDVVARAYPQDTISIDGNDYHYAMLYRLKPPSWANVTVILAFCARLYRTGTGVRVVGIEAASSSKKTKTMSETIKTGVQQLLTKTDVLFIPVSFGNMHWCAIIVDVKQNNVLYCDFMSLKIYKSVLDRLSGDLATTLSDDFTVVSVNASIQTDGYNCKFYVVLRFGRYVDKNGSLDVTPTGLTLLRLHILHFVLYCNGFVATDRNDFSHMNDSQFESVRKMAGIFGMEALQSLVVSTPAEQLERVNAFGAYEQGLIAHVR
ncbi:hypothetical protein PInf_016764 [Phytophthora infestans]|nr:hypothetical protein PInf_016764 [Phytophthora infestans]